MASTEELGIDFRISVGRYLTGGHPRVAHRSVTYAP
jgi:hypothetical protein